MSSPALVVLTAISAIGCGALVFAEWKRRPELRIAAKLCASLAFVALAYFAKADPPHGFGAFTDWMFGGLVLGLIGDIALLGRTNRAFLAGLAAFLLGHIAYVIGIAQLIAPSAWVDAAGGYVIAPVIVGLGALALLWRKLGTMRIPVIAYVIAIMTMMVGAIAAWRGAPIPSGNRTLLVIGAALFFASDLSVAREKFIGHTLTNQLWGLPAYFAGQLLIAWSLAYES